MIAARLSPGAISESSSSHLPPSVASKLAKPVIFPPGWLSPGTMPLATGSATAQRRPVPTRPDTPSGRVFHRRRALGRTPDQKYNAGLDGTVFGAEFLHYY